MKVFLTGATGFLGRRLVKRLLADHVEVVALVRGQEHRLPDQVRTVLGDILDEKSLFDAGRGCNTLYHLAGMISFDPRTRERLLRVNGLGTRNVLTAAGRWGVTTSVVVSSACTIGLSCDPSVILDENEPYRDDLAKANPYMDSKISAERVALDFSEKQNVVIVNPSTCYGPDDWTLNSGTIISKVARSSVLPVPPGGGNVVDVDDVAGGIIAAGRLGRRGARYILGGENLLFSDIFRTIADVVGRRPLMVPAPRWARKVLSFMAAVAGRLSGNRLLSSQIIDDLFAFKYYSSRRAGLELDWRPRYSFRESAQRAWDFYQREGLA